MVPGVVSDDRYDGDPLRLEGDDGVAFEMSIEGYQFPDATADSQNWLQVWTRAEHPRGTWEGTDPSLEAQDLVHLAAWFEALAPDRATRCEFTEPNLAFELTADALLRVCLTCESAPPWVVGEARWFEGFALCFPLSRVDPVAAARTLRRWVARYPSR